MGLARGGQAAETTSEFEGAGYPGASGSCTPREALAMLPDAGRARLGRFRDRLHASWATGAPHLALASAVGDLDPGSAACAFPVGAPGASWTAQTLTQD